MNCDSRNNDIGRMMGCFFTTQEVVILKPGGPGSKAALGSKKKGHGRNWAVEGPGWELGLGKEPWIDVDYRS